MTRPKNIIWLDQCDSMGVIGVISSCGRFRIREHAFPNFRWCLWDSKKRNARPVGSPARTLESAQRMAERRVSR